MKNIMYFKLKMGEESSPLRDMALENFPNVNLYETDIHAEQYGEKDVLKHIIRQIKDGKYDKLYIKSISALSRNANESFEIMNGIAAANPNFEIELKGGVILKPKDLVNKLFHTMMQTFAEIERCADQSDTKEIQYTNYIDVKIECEDKEATINLPISEMVIEEELKNAGIRMENDSDVRFTVDTSYSKKFENLIKMVCEEKGIYIANDICADILNYGMHNGEKILAVIEYTNADTTDKVMRIVNDTDGFAFIRNAKSLEDIGRYWVTKDMESSVEREIDQYMDYKALGRDIMRDYEGKFVEGGCILNRGEVDIEHLFTMTDENEEGMTGMQGM